MITMSKIIGIYSEKNFRKATASDVFVLMQNAEGNVYGYLPYVKQHISLNREEQKEYNKGTYTAGCIELTFDEFEKIRKRKSVS